MAISSESATGRWFRKNLKNIPEENCRFTSKCTSDYNCVGFVVGDYQWWHPEQQRGHYWPDGVSRDFSVDSYIAALATAKFEICPIQNEAPEHGYEKIAVFGFKKCFKHVALITDNGIWKSKLGEYEDIEHPPTPVRMGKYGFRVKYMRREIKYSGEPLPDEYKL